MKTTTDPSWNGILQLMALAEVLKNYCSVVSIYPAVSYHFRFILMSEFLPVTTHITINIYFMYYGAGTDTWEYLWFYVSAKPFCSSSHTRLIQMKGVWRKRIGNCPKRNICKFCLFFNQNKFNSAKVNQKMKLELEITFWYSLEYKKVR